MKRIGMAALAAACVLSTISIAEARNQIRIAGSSTVFPFTAAVAEHFARSTQFNSPVVESTGTGGGFKIFCQGLGLDTTDVSNASRPIKQSEKDLCAQNGVTDIIEIKIGYDGIVLVHSKRGHPMSITIRELWLALAAEVPVNGSIVPNPYKKWSEINPALPDISIRVYGPPPTSGTRDAFVELVMDVGCKSFDVVESLPVEKKTIVCQRMRQDGAFVEAGENDNLIVQKLTQDKNAFGIFGYGFLDQNLDKLQGAMVNGMNPTFENIASGAYSVSRSLFIYVKGAHLGVISGLKEFMREYLSERALGDEGYLADKGLIPLLPEELDSVRQSVLPRLN